MAEEMRLPSAHRPDSQGICFLGKINYRDFIKAQVGEKIGEIRELETNKLLGEHKGYWFHTIGQRKGLGLSQGPWFVIKKDIPNNIIYVSKGYDPLAQYSDIIPLNDLHFITKNPFKNLENGEEIKFKIRHTPEFSSGTLFKKENKIYIHSKQKMSGIAPGQFAVFYNQNESICLGSGIIAE